MRKLSNGLETDQPAQFSSTNYTMKAYKSLAVCIDLRRPQVLMHDVREENISLKVYDGSIEMFSTLYQDILIQGVL